MARAHEARDEHARRFDLVANDGVDGLVAQVAIEQHEGHLAPLELGDLLGRQCGRDDGAVDLVLPHFGHGLVDVALARHRKQQDAHAARGELAAQFGQHVGEVQGQHRRGEHGDHREAAEDDEGAVRVVLREEGYVPGFPC